MHKRTIAIGVSACVAALAVVVAPDRGHPAASAALAGGQVRPGPAVLYEPPPAAPQLENRSRWFRAEPILVSGTEEYADGEYLYQDHLYDDYGAGTGAADAAGPAGAGDIEYPTERSRYGGNAADLVEFRISAGRDVVAYRFTFNTLLASDSTIATAAFDTDRRAGTGSDRLPRDPGAPFPGTDEVITVWGTGAEHTRFLPGGRPLTTPLAVTTDLEANQMTVVVPRSVSDPHGVWRATVATGLFDPPSGGWLRPQPQASPSRPGGATAAVPAPPGIFNLAFRFSEPVLRQGVPPDTAQAAALAAGAPTRFAHDIDFAALAAGENRSTVPKTGTQIRIFPSRLRLGEGRDPRRSPRYLGQLQPYALSVPGSYRPGEPAPFTLQLHSLTRHHWQYLGSEGLEQLGDERGSLVLTPLARGLAGWYQHEAEYDTFEAWADVARHFDLDWDRVAITGYSMGGYGTYRLATLYPDLFGRAMTIDGPPCAGTGWVPPAPPAGGRAALTTPWLPNARHVPFLNVVAAQDEVVPLAGTRAQHAAFEQMGYRSTFVVEEGALHSTAPGLGYAVPQATAFLGDAEVVHDPGHVTFVYDPAADDPALGLIHDHAYWASGLVLAAGSGGALGRLDAVRHTATNVLTVRLSNLSAVRLDLDRAGLDTKRDIVIDVTSDAGGALRLAGPAPLSVPFASGKNRYVLGAGGKLSPKV